MTCILKRVVAILLCCVILSNCASLRNPNEDELEKFKRESDCSDLRKMVEETAMEF